jgi:glycine cleavage system H lipoate-binding protein
MVTLAFIGGILIVFLLDVFVIQNLEKRMPQPETSAGHSKDKDAGSKKKPSCKMPRGYFFHPGHVWARIQDNGHVAVGIDDFARTTLGPIKEISVPDSGKKLSSGEAVFELTIGARKLSFVSPLSGTIAKINDAATASPAIVNAEPYGSGWIVEIQPDESPVMELADLFIAAQATDWMTREIEALHKFIDKRAPGGSPSGILTWASTETIKEFGNTFLSPAAANKEA